MSKLAATATVPETTARPPTRRSWRAGPLDHLAGAVTAADQLNEQSDALIGYFVDQARSSGASWSQIGAAMGVSKQAAQKRFVARDDEPTPEGKTFTRFTPRLGPP